MADVEIKGAEDFYKLSRALKQAGRVTLRRELSKGLQLASKPLIATTREAARAELPKAGGLGAQVAKAPMKVQVRTAARTAGVRITSSARGVRGSDKGTVRHPVFGDRKVFVSQQVQPGWFTETLERGAPLIRPELVKAMQHVVDQVVRGH